jgi:hypothetical protein
MEHRRRRDAWQDNGASGGPVLESTGRVQAATSWLVTAAVGARRGRGRRAAAAAQHLRRAPVALPFRREQEGAWRRTRVAAAPCAVRRDGGAPALCVRWRRCGRLRRGRGRERREGSKSSVGKRSRSRYIYLFQRIWDEKLEKPK